MRACKRSDITNTKYDRLPTMIPYALTIFVSSFLLLLVQPVIAKQILPWFGGSATVWTTCLVFFQCTLLVGYFYVDWTTRNLTLKRQAWLHIGLIAVAIMLLPIVPDAGWKPGGEESPSLRILLLLTATIGLPYFLITTTSPLVQVWYSNRRSGASPYRLFALSNLASMLALLSYPFLIEPWITTQQQAAGWSVGFTIFAILICSLAWRQLGADRNKSDIAPVSIDVAVAATAMERPAPTATDKLTWIALSALASVLLLSVTNHLTENISSIPLMWVIPLALYLLTFILCFDTKETRVGWYRRKLFLPLLVVLLVVMAWTLADRDLAYRLYWQIGVFSAGLFVACMFCHGELAALKPAARYLTGFYLMVSIGGALGALLVGIVAPMTLSGYFELPISICVIAALSTYLMWHKVHLAINVIGGLVTLFTAAAAIHTVVDYRVNVISSTRNFYGTLRVRETVVVSPDYRRRELLHGAILHGDQYMWSPINVDPMTYYKEKSGVGRILLLNKSMHPDQQRAVGIIGLGTGTIAAYGRRGDTYRFYEINPDVVTIANRDFTYLKDTKAKIEISLGDARLNLEREPARNFDVLAIDAFSSDAIPIHLITLDALDIYERNIRPGGVIAFHVSNRYLDLKPVVRAIAQKRGFNVAWVRETYNDGGVRSDWVLITKDKTLFQKPEIADGTRAIQPTPDRRIWTDDFNNLLQALQ